MCTVYVHYCLIYKLFLFKQLSLPEPRRHPSSLGVVFPVDVPLLPPAPGSPAPTLGSQGRAVLCRGRAGETRRFKDCLDGSRTTVVPADRQMCLVNRDCQVQNLACQVQNLACQVLHLACQVQNLACQVQVQHLACQVQHLAARYNI
jgi:hypothetical protein